MWLLWLCKWSFLYVYNNSHCSQRVLVIDITWVDTKQKFMWTGKSLCALPVEQNETGQRLNLTLMYKVINYKDVYDWRISACDCNILGTTSHNLLFSRQLGRHYQETKGHPRSFVVAATFTIDYNPERRLPSDNTIKAKIIKQIGGGSLRWRNTSKFYLVWKDTLYQLLQKSVYPFCQVFIYPLYNKDFLLFQCEHPADYGNSWGEKPSCEVWGGACSFRKFSRWTSEQAPKDQRSKWA